MDRIIQLPNGSIEELNKLETEIKHDFNHISYYYPFNEYFHEMVSRLKKWKSDIENS